MTYVNFSRKDLNWKNIKDVQFVGAMGRPGGARNPVDPRFITRFNVFEIQFPANSSLSHIYSAILDAHLQKLSAEVKVIILSIWLLFELLMIFRRLNFM
jgi:dynein heavy chain